MEELSVCEWRAVVQHAHTSFPQTPFIWAGPSAQEGLGWGMAGTEAEGKLLPVDQ